MSRRAWLAGVGCLLLALIPVRLPAGGSSEVKPFNLDKLNTEADEDDPFTLSDGVTLLYATKVKGTFDIYLSQRATEKQAWPAGRPYIASATYDERSPFFHKASNKLYFAMNRALEGMEEEKNFDIVQKILETAPVPLPGVSTPEDEINPWVTPLGKEFYFSRMTKKGWLLYQGDGPMPGPIGGANPIGFPPDFHHATLSASGLLMYLQGPVDGQEGKSAIYRSRRTKVGASWSRPELIAGLAHAEAKRGDCSPCLSPDGARLYFASDRPGGKGGLDLWYVLTAQLK